MPATIVLSAYPGRYTPGGRELALSIGGAVPQRRVEVTDLVSVIKAVAAFGHDVQAANPAADVDQSAPHRRLVDPAAAVDRARAPELAQ